MDLIAFDRLEKRKALMLHFTKTEPGVVRKAPKVVAVTGVVSARLAGVWTYLGIIKREPFYLVW